MGTISATQTSQSISVARYRKRVLCVCVCACVYVREHFKCRRNLQTCPQLPFQYDEHAPIVLIDLQIPI